MIRLTLCEALWYYCDESTVPVRYAVSKVDIINTSEARGFGSVCLSGGIGIQIVGTMRYHLKAYSVPMGYVGLRRCISAAVYV
jgi:hypothetical protein